MSSSCHYCHSSDKETYRVWSGTTVLRLKSCTNCMKSNNILQCGYPECERHFRIGKKGFHTAVFNGQSVPVCDWCVAEYKRVKEYHERHDIIPKQGSMTAQFLAAFEKQ